MGSKNSGEPLHDSAIPVSRLVTIGAWSVAGVLLAAAWIVGLLVSTHVGLLLGFTANVVAGGAAASQVRCYCLRATRMVLAGLRETTGEQGEVRAMRR